MSKNLCALSAAALTAVFLAGCAASAPAPAPAPPAAAAPAPAPEPEPAKCDAAPAQFAIGQAVTPQLEAAVMHRTGAQTVRVLKPKQAITMEFNHGRVNLEVNARGRVTAVRCG